MFAAPLNKLGGPVKTPFGYYLYEVKGTKPGNQKPLRKVHTDDQADPARADQQQKALSKFIKEFKKKWLAKTECRAGYVVANCKEYKAPRTRAGSTTTTAPEGG